MKNILTGLIMLAFVLAGAGLIRAADPQPAATPEKAAAKCYVCDKCCTMAMQPGKCGMCGSEMKAKHLLAIKDGTGSFCDCPDTCKCTLKEADTSKCSCGKAVAKVSLKGKYVCGCADCKCNTIADKPGKCSCGNDLKKVE